MKKYSTILKLHLIALLWLSHTLYAQNSTKPSAPPGAFTNSVDFNLNTNQFIFKYQGTDGALSYEYTPAKDASFAPIHCTINNSYTFTPSLGGLSFDANGTEIFTHSANSISTILSLDTLGDTLTIRWSLRNFSDSIIYAYKIFISARTLVIHLVGETPNAQQIYLDRCDNAIDPVVIPIPYLPLLNVLCTNGSFVSLFFDWEKTNASQIYPNDNSFSSTSVRFGQNIFYNKRTDDKRNFVNEFIYLTASPSLSDVLPNVPNPASPLKTVSSNRTVMDCWDNDFAQSLASISSCQAAGVKNAWVILHGWQNGGYDNMYPDVLPAGAAYGGSAALLALKDTLVKYNYLFALHENYVDFYPNAPSFSTADVALNSDGSLKDAFKYIVQSKLMKPSVAVNYVNTFSKQINQTYATTAAYLDVHSGATPSDFIDYDSGIADAGTFRQTLQSYRAVASASRLNHAGPVSGEGNFHFLYAGYFDDAEAQINTGKAYPYLAGSKMPLLVDFQLTKLHDLMCAHGVGYYERFFAHPDGSATYHPFPLDTTLIYIATELAYGQGSYIPGSTRVKDVAAVAKLEYQFVFPAQLLYANSSVVSITYDDNGEEINSSEYIRRHPLTFTEITSPDFMSKVKVTYANGTIVFVNRHPTQTWAITTNTGGNFYDYHALINSIDSIDIANVSTSSNWVLPANSGWMVFSPQQLTGQIESDEIKSSIQLFPNPANSQVFISTPLNINSQTEIFNSMGQRVSEWKNAHVIDISGLEEGVYYVKVKTVDSVVCLKLIKQ